MEKLNSKITALIAVVELTENKVGLNTLKEIQEDIRWNPIETLTYEATEGKKFIGKNKYGCISTARISNSGIKSDDQAIPPFTHWLPFL